MHNKLFAYGTLQASDVMKTVTGETLRGVAGCLPGYARYSVRDTEYPGITASPNHETPGILYSNISEEKFQILDRFEGEYYERQIVKIELSEGSSTNAWAYVFRDEYKYLLSDELWDYEEFLKSGLGSFMEGYVVDRTNAI
jgi:gamma-glutamylcyclotransferase (GGCT)/AIG2-like uncharacterized protein YtfP